jgi:hypothetical protein
MTEAISQLTDVRNRMATFVGQSGDTFETVIYIRVDMVIMPVPMSVATVLDPQIRH